VIEVGTTWNERRIDNRPRQLATYDAMRELSERVLDRVWDEFGGMQITYAFASGELDKLVHLQPNAQTSRSLDQHAGCELNKDGRPFCKRLGLSVDFHVHGINSATVARWVATNTEFDRLYFYGMERPIHVSVGPDNKRQLTAMRRLASGFSIPRRISVPYFDELMR
jgi:hypothetical protein